MNRLTLCLIVLFLQVTAVTAQFDSESLIVASSNKVKQLNSIQYDYKNERYFNSGHFTRLETKVSFRRLAYGEYDVRLSGQRYMSVKNSTRNFSFSQTRTDIKYLNHDDKTARIVDKALGILGTLNGEEINVIGSHFDHFKRKDPLNSQEESVFSYEGVQKFAGVNCHVITMPYGNDFTDTFYWYISENDSLPRGYKFKGGMVEVKNVSFDQLLKKEAFDLNVPADYEQIEVHERNLGDMISIKREANKEGITFSEGTTPPSWEATDLLGNHWSSADLRGKVVVIDFWGVWCVPCIRAMPKVQKLHDTFARDGLIVLGFDVKDKREKVVKYIERNAYTYPIIPDADPIAASFKIEAYPTFFIIGKDGRVVFAERGFRNNAYDEWAEIIAIELKK